MQQSYVRILINLVERYGIDPSALMRGLPLSRAHLLGEAHFTRAQFNQLLEHAVALTGHPELALEFGSRLNVGSHGVLGYALMSCATINEAMKLFLHYYKILVPEAEIRLVDSEKTLHLQCRVRGLSLNIERFTLESVFASFCTTCRFLVSRPLPGAELYLQYGRPDYADAYLEMFEFPVHFSAADSYLSLSPVILDWPLETHHPASSGIFREQCDALLAPLLDEAHTANQVRQLLLSRHGKTPDLATVAGHLHISERTLKRRLRAEGTSFGILSDQIKARLAAQYLNNSGLPVADIGALVGYDDVSNFRTAFRRWFGTTPQAFRLDNVES